MNNEQEERFPMQGEPYSQVYGGYNGVSHQPSHQPVPPQTQYQPSIKSRPVTQTTGIKGVFEVELLIGSDCNYFEAQLVMQDILDYIKTHTDAIRMQLTDITAMKEEELPISTDTSATIMNPIAVTPTAVTADTTSLAPLSSTPTVIPPVPVFPSDQLV